jgi:hypothetical protein
MPAGTFLPPGLTTSDVKITSGGTNNYVLTAVDGETIQGESALQFDGNDLLLADTIGMVIGHTAQVANMGGSGMTPELQVLGVADSDSSITIGNFSTGSRPRLVFVRSKNTSIGGKTIVATDDSLGMIMFAGDDGVDYHMSAVRIEAFADTGTQSTSSMPGRLTFATTADGTSSVTERMRIKSNGMIELNSDGGAIDHGFIFDGNAVDYHIGLDDTADDLVIGVGTALGTTTAMSINDDGHIGFNGVSPGTYSQTLFSGDADTIPAAGVSGEIARVYISNSNAITIGTGVTGLAASMIIWEPNIVEAGGDGVTNAATLFIANAPTEGGTGNYALWVDAGSVRLDGSLWVEGTPTEGSAGEQLTSGGADTVMSWAAASSLGQFKDTIDILSSGDALDKIVSWIPRSFRYKADAEMSTHDYDTTYVGVYGEDAPEVMHHEGRIFSPVSAFGYTVGAIQELHNKIQQLEAQLAAS